MEEKEKKLQALQFDYRRACREDLGDYVGGAPKLPVHVAAVFLARSHKTIYAWISQKMFLPELEDCKLIDKLCTTIDRVRESWKTVLISFPLPGLHSAVKMALYSQPFLRILEDQKTTIDKKISLLTAKTFRAWSKDLEAKN